MNELIVHVIELYTRHKDIDKVMAILAKDYNLDEKEIQYLHDVFNTLDGIAEKQSSLQEAKESGESRREWLDKQLDAIFDGSSDDEKASMLDSVTSGLEDSINKQLEE